MKFYKNSNGNVYCYGIEIPGRDLTEGYISYATLSSMGDCVLCNYIYNYCDAEIVSGNDYDEECEEYVDVYQTYIISEGLKNIIMELCPDEIIRYVEDLGVYTWDITHFGTSWSYVNTSCKIEFEDNN